MDEKWTNTSGPPSCWMNPKPFFSLNHFTVPRAISAHLLGGIAWGLTIILLDGNFPLAGKTKTTAPTLLGQTQSLTHATSFLQILSWTTRKNSPFHPSFNAPVPNLCQHCQSLFLADFFGRLAGQVR